MASHGTLAQVFGAFDVNQVGVRLCAPPHLARVIQRLLCDIW
jgi:hypothetical protein